MMRFERSAFPRLNLSALALFAEGIDNRIIRNYIGYSYSGEDMHTNTQFAVAIHSLALIELFPGWDAPNCLSSAVIAESVNTNPVVIRRVMGALRDHGLVQSQSGPGGGWTLSRPGDQINLRDVFRAVQEESIFAMPRQEPSEQCPVGGYLPSVLVRCFSEAEAALLDRLALVSIADVVESVRAGCSCRWEPGISSEEIVLPAVGA